MKRAWLTAGMGVVVFSGAAGGAHLLRTPVKNGTVNGSAVVYEDGDDFDNYSGSTWISSAVVDPNSATDPPNPLLDPMASLWDVDGSPALVNDGKLSAGDGYDRTTALADYKHATTNLRLGFRNRRNLTSVEMANADVVHGRVPTCVNGTDAHPLIFKFRMNLGPKKDNVYFHKLNVFGELTCGDDRAPTKVIELDEDDYCYNNNGIPLVRYMLDMNGDGLAHRSIAVGQIAWADRYPCFDPDPSVTNPAPKSYRLTMYDGRQWRHLYNWPSSGVNIHTCGDYNLVTLTIKSTTIDVQLRSLYNGTDCTGVNKDFVTYTTTVPRQYLGPFTAIKVGGLHDEVHGGVWGQDKVAPDFNGEVRAYPEQGTAIDNVDLYGGEAYDTPAPCEDSGACCKADYTCERLTPAACEAIEGAEFQGLGTACGVGAGRCCAGPAVDGDHDGDVDMADFARLQRCITSGGGAIAAGCECFDTNGDGTIGENDVIQFAQCALGSGVAADPDCD